MSDDQQAGYSNTHGKQEGSGGANEQGPGPQEDDWEGGPRLKITKEL